MSLVVVPALKPLDYRGRSYVRGEMVEMEAVDAAVAARRDEVALDGREVKVERGRRRNTYRRRDMTAANGE